MQLADVGPEVARWQEELVQTGYVIAVDGVFGQDTHHATLALQAAAGLPATGKVGQAEWDAAREGRLSWPTRPPPVFPETIPYVECRCWARDVKRDAVDLIVLHCMQAPESASTAENCARWLASLPPSEKPRSCHYFVDCDSIVQGVHDERVAWHAPGANATGIGIEHAGFARQSRAEWLDEFGSRMLSLSAELSARLCKKWHIPPIFVGADDLQKKRPGITTHAEVTRAFPEKSHGHTDPGPYFPIGWYIGRVDAALRFKETVT